VEFWHLHLDRLMHIQLQCRTQQRGGNSRVPAFGTCHLHLMHLQLQRRTQQSGGSTLEVRLLALDTPAGLDACCVEHGALVAADWRCE
jgi:hypothetical protein